VNRSAKGRHLEYRSRRILEAEGFSVIRSAASKGAFDLVAFRRDGAVLVQVRASRWPSPSELEALGAFPAPEGMRRVVHRWLPRAAAPEIRELVP
jgi:Holliday junction resolvase-like predicted endonuclease